MAVSRTLADTSAWIETLRTDGDQTVRELVVDLTKQGSIVLSHIVLLELWNGAKGQAEYQILRDLSRELEIVPTTAEVWELAIDLAQRSRRKGLTIPATDLLIAACARHHGLQVLAVDQHFEELISILPDDGH